LLATALLHLLMLGTPQPGVFLKWIMGLVTLAAIVYPFSTGAPLDQKIATAVVDLVLGVAIASLLAAVSARAVRRVDNRNVLRQGYDRRGYVEQPRGYGEPPRGYDGSREYGRPGYERGPQGYDRPAYDPRGYDNPGDRRGYDRREAPTRQYPPQDRWS
jgi:membrane protein implicated in regulation of membrane protease activity